MANSSQLSLPKISAPAASRRATAVQSYGGIKVSRTFEPAVVRTPPVTMTSLIAKGTPADEAMGRLGEPDMEYENAPGIFPWDPPGDRIVVYYVAMNRTIKTLPLSAAQYIESIELVFGNDNHYKGYWVDNPLHPFRLDAPPDRDLASLIRKGPAASTLPVVSQPAP